MGRVEDALQSAYQVHRYWEADDKDALLASVGPDVRAVATSGDRGCSRAIIEKLPKLEVIANYGVGYDSVDIAACKERGVRVTNTPDVLNDAVAELAVGLMIALCRRIPQADQFVRLGRWGNAGGDWAAGFPLTGELTGKTAGILGLGRIGKEIARRLQVFKMQVVYHGRSEQPDTPFPYYASLVEMARAVDWLVVIAPGTPQTKHIVNREVLEALGPEGAVVNVARGSLIDETAMLDCLKTGKLGGAALDVFEAEPSVPDGFWGLENVVLSPHQGSATHKTRAGMGDLVVRNLAAHFAGDPLLTPVA
ncbi:MAG: 2-hydroxyacid dehydrogenase [Pseudomonadota bacterium]